MIGFTSWFAQKLSVVVQPVGAEGLRLAVKRLGSTQAAASTRRGWSKSLRAAGLFSVIVCTASTASAQWTITDLGALPGEYGRTIASGINNAGQVVGNAYTASGSSRGFMWQNGVMTNLGDLPGGGNSSQAYAINNAGQVVGVSGSATGNQGFLWQNGVMTNLGNLPGGSFDSSIALAINNAGQVVGSSLAATGEFTQNNRAFLWQNGAMTNLGALPGGDDYSNATGVNNAGQVVGYGGAATGDRAFLWQNGVMTNLGDLPGGNDWSQAYGINNVGQVVGRSLAAGTGAFLWQNGAMTNLSIAPGVDGTGWTLHDARAINDSGQIVGYGTNPLGETHAYMLTPVPEPGQLAILLAGLGLTAWRAKQRRSNSMS